ncbi:hypothetical protein [Variovorax paradoxus]|uniref:hypothetical protein n=1 Tax=Variovorax paradoxus TaxID=34073 RepID=UPI001ABCC0BF
MSKDSGEFYANPRNSTGFQSRCKSCIKARNVERRAEIIEYARQYRWEDARVRMASDARRRDRAAGRESDIEAKDIVVPKTCPITGKLLFHAVDQPLGCSPCLIRLDKTKGYIAGNWMVVSAGSQPFGKRPIS